MQIPNPAPVAKGLAIAVATLVAIPATCRWIEAHPAMGIFALLALTRFGASRSSLPSETATERRSRPRSAPNRLRS